MGNRQGVTRCAPLALIWGCFSAVFTNVLYFTKYTFDTYFKDTADYLLVVGIIFASFIASSIASRFMRGKGIVLASFIASALLSFTWFLLSWNLPSFPSSTGCNSWICQETGQIMLASLLVGILPPFLMELTKRFIGPRERVGFPPIALLAAGSGLIIEGVSATMLDYTAPFFITALLLLVMAASILVLFLFNAFKRDAWMHQRGRINRGADATVKAKGKGKGKGKGKAPVNSDLMMLVRDLLVVLLVVVLGYSTIDATGYALELLVETGAGILTFGAVLMISMKISKRQDILHHLEGNLIAILVATIWMTRVLVGKGLDLELDVGLPTLIVGFSSGYFWTRLFNIPAGIPHEKAFTTFRFKRANIHGFNKFGMFFYLLIFIILGIVQISPNSGESELIFNIACVISVISMISWTISFGTRKLSGKKNLKMVA
ncbi:MAG: hypothetical protein ACTSUE_23970 [Promethearchaeota archaeon]